MKKTAANRAWCLANPGRKQALSKSWYMAQKAKNPQHVILRARIRHWQNKYGLLLGDMTEMLARQAHICFGCWEYINLWSCTIDHILATKNGGAHSLENFQLLCLPCNRAKQELSMAGFIEHCRRVVEAHP